MSNSDHRLSKTLFDRRSVLVGTGATVGVTALSGTAWAQTRVDEVAIDKLMAPGDLPELSQGPDDAKVTIVEYASMSCPACARFHQITYPKLKEKYIETGKIRFIMREFPLNNLAAAASMLARCADTPAKSIGLIDVLFEKQADWAVRNPVPPLLKIAKQAGFTEKTFNSCLENNELLGKIAKGRDKADKEFGVDATPSFFINGKRMRTRNYTIEAFDKILEPLLKSS